jgi:hypothetical protein
MMYENYRYHIVIVILNDVGRCQYTCILKIIIMIRWHYFRIIQFYLLNVTCIVLYIFGSVATHGYPPSLRVLLNVDMEVRRKNRGAVGCAL